VKFSVKTANLEDLEVPLVIIGVTSENLDKLCDESKSGKVAQVVKEIINLGDFKGKENDIALAYTLEKLKTKRLLLVGLGDEKNLSAEIIRQVLGVAGRKVRDLGVKRIGVSLDHFIYNNLPPEEVAEAIVQGIVLGSYNNKHFQTKKLDTFKEIEEGILFSNKIDVNLISQAVKSGKIIADSVNFCRQLAWRPANYITPTKLAEEAKRLERELGVKTTIFDRKKAEEIGLTSFLAVAQGTEEPPKFIIMEYGAEKKNVDTVALVGKAITFDSGGISIKPSQNMKLMKADMTGGAVVIATMEAIAKLGIDLHVVGIVPATDNMPSGKACRPGDVITSYSGHTIEVISTDAEGRMILNDGLTYAAKHYKPKAIFDFATLTGAMMVALGSHAIGYFANDEEVAERLEQASKTSGERIWRMPLWEEYDEQLKSDVADLKHSGGRPAGAITAARFLSNFVMDTPWAHLDIAGVMKQEATKGYNPKGSKGPAVRLIIDVLRNWNK